MLGLAPSKHLRQIDTPFLLHQLLSQRIVERPIFSLMLVSGHEGVLSIGGTAAQAAELVSKQTAEQLDRAGAEEKINAFTEENGKTLEGGTNSLDKNNIPEEKVILQRRGVGAEGLKTRRADWREGWTWSKVQGAEGWWQTLMQGVWVGGSRVLQNQAVVIDVRLKTIANSSKDADLHHRSTRPLSSLRLWQPRRSTRQWQVLVPSTHRTRTSTFSPA